MITTYAGNGGGNSSSPLGDGGPATSAYIGVAKDLAVDAAGNLYIAGNAGGVARVRKVTPGAGLTASPSALSFAFTIGGSAPADQSLSVTSTGSAVSFTAAATTSGRQLAIGQSLERIDARDSERVDQSVVSGVSGGTYQGAITLTPSSGSAQSSPSRSR